MFLRKPHPVFRVGRQRNTHMATSPRVAHITTTAISNPRFLVWQVKYFSPRLKIFALNSVVGFSHLKILIYLLFLYFYFIMTEITWIYIQTHNYKEWYIGNDKKKCMLWYKYLIIALETKYCEFNPSHKYFETRINKFNNDPLWANALRFFFYKNCILLFNKRF